MSSRWTVDSCEIEHLLNQTLKSRKERLLLLQDVAYLFRALLKNEKEKSKWGEKRLKRIESSIHALYIEIGHYERVQKKINKKEKLKLPQRPCPRPLRSSARNLE